MRILAVTTSYPRYPQDLAGVFVARACEALVARGHQVTVVCPHAPDLAEEEEMRGVRIRRFCYGPKLLREQVAYNSGIPDNLKNNWRARLGLPWFLAAMHKAVNKYAPEHDLIHAHWAVCGMLSARAARRHGKPLLLSLRGSDMNTGGRIGCWILRQACAGADKIICVSRGIRDQVDALGLAPGKATVLPNGIDPEFLLTDKTRQELRRKLCLDPETLYLIAVGRLVQVKNHDFMLRMFAALLHDTRGDLSWMAGENRRYPNLTNMQHALAEDMTARGFVTGLARAIDRCRLLILGQGELEPVLKTLAQELGINDRVDFVGNLPHAEVAEWLQASDIMLHTSFSEGRSNAILEAMACGLPCIGPDIDGVRELIEHARTGLLYEPGDKTGFIAGICHLLCNSANRRFLANNARKWVQERDCSWEAHAKILEQKVREMMNDE